MLAKEVVEAAGPSGRIACIACPSLFRQLRAAHPDASAHLLEFDPRFEVTDCLTQEATLHVIPGKTPMSRAPFESIRSVAWQFCALQLLLALSSQSTHALLSCLSKLN